MEKTFTHALMLSLKVKFLVVPNQVSNGKNGSWEMVMELLPFVINAYSSLVMMY
jgi:hypothetical protein